MASSRRREPARHVVATTDEIPPGSRKIVTIEGKSIGVFNLGGEFYAIRNTCPHAGGPLCEGPTSSLVTSDRPGSYDVTRPGEFIRCPWHAWEFDIKTGQSWFDPGRMRVKSYPASVVEEDLAPGAPARREKGPYIAEVYPVSVRRRLVVLEL